MVRISLSFFCLFLLLFLALDLSAQENKKYLKANRVLVPLEKLGSPPELAQFSKEIATAQVVLAGEVHRQKGNFTSFEYLIRYLHREHDFRFIGVEFGPVLTEMLNSYLQNGDPELLEKIRFFLFVEEPFFDWLTSLQRWNSILPENRKIELIGFDLEMQTPIALAWLAENLPDGEPPIAIEKWIKALRDFHQQDAFERDTVDLLGFKMANAFALHSLDFKAFLGEKHFETWAQGLKGIINAKQFRNLKPTNLSAAYKFREELLFKKISFWIDDFPERRIFAQLGQVHASGCEVREWGALRNWQSLAYRLRHQKEVEVQTISYYYPNWKSDYDKDLYSLEMLALLKKLSWGKLTLFHIAELWKEGKTNACFDYILVNKFK